MDLIIIRHGRPVRQVAEDGETADPGLSEVGHEQALRTADFLESEGVDHILSSTMTRAVETAAPLATRLGIEVEALDDLRESDHKNQVYVPAEEISPDDPDTAHFFDGNLMDHIFSEGYEPFQKRIAGVFDYIIETNKSKRVAIFCHGMVTSVFLQATLGFDDPLALRIDYCGLTRVRASSTGVRSVRSVNETYHVRELIDW